MWIIVSSLCTYIMAEREDSSPAAVGSTSTTGPLKRFHFQTRSPTDDAQVSPISKVLVGHSKRKRSRSQALNAVIANARTKKTREAFENLSKPSARNNNDECENGENYTDQPSSQPTPAARSLMERQKDRIRKMVLVPVSPNIPRAPSANMKKTPKFDHTPKHDARTPKPSKTPMSSSKKSMFDVLADDVE